MGEGTGVVTTDKKDDLKLSEKKAYSFTFKQAENYDEVLEILNALMNPEMGGLSFTLVKERFDKIPKKLIEPTSIKETTLPDFCCS